MAKKKAELGRNQKAEPKGSVCHQLLPKLSKGKADIYSLLKNSGMTVSQIASTRKCSKRYVRRVKKELTDMGLFGLVPPEPKEGGDPGTPGTILPKNSIRLHAQKFTIELINPISEYYLEKFRNQIFRLEKHHIACYPNSIVIQAEEGFSFYGENEDEALHKAMVYWARFFKRLETETRTLILKDRKLNIKFTYQEWATENSKISETAEKKDKRIKIFGQDGKLRFTTDWSKTLEHETHSAITGKQDSERINEYFSSIMDNPEVPNPAEIARIVYELSRQNVYTNNQVMAITELIKGLLPKQEQQKPDREQTELANYIG